MAICACLDNGKLFSPSGVSAVDETFGQCGTRGRTSSDARPHAGMMLVHFETNTKGIEHVAPRRQGLRDYVIIGGHSGPPKVSPSCGALTRSSTDPP